MASWRGEIDIPAPEVRRLTAVLPLVAERLRRLDLRDGVLLDPFDPEQPLSIHLADGVHPAPGARYEASWPESEHGWAATVESDDARSLRATAIDEVGGDDEMRLTVEVPMPAHPTELRFEHLMAISDDGFMAGSVESDAVLSWEMLAVADSGVHRLLSVSSGHPRFRAGIVVDAEPSGPTWRLTSEAFVSGRGLMRPAFGFMMFFVARRLRRVVDERFAEVVDRVEEWNAFLAEHPDDEALAAEIVDRWLDRFREHPEPELSP